MIDYRIEDMLRSQLMVSLQNLHHWNSYLGILTSLFFFFLCANYRNVHSFIMDTIIPLTDYVKTLHGCSIIELRGTILEDIYGSRKHYSKRFVSLLHYIHSSRAYSLSKNICNVRKLLEICVEDMDYVLNRREDELLIAQVEPLLIAEDIFCKFSILVDDTRSEKVKC